MQDVVYGEIHEVDLSPFSALVGEDITSFIWENAPRKVLTRVVRALEHYVRSEKLIGIDEEMGAIRLIAAEEELVVAIFEWLKLNVHCFPEHKDFVGKFKNHVVKLTFYPVLLHFRFIMQDMLLGPIAPAGMEGVINWNQKPVVDGKQIKLALYDENGEELIRHNPFAIDISTDDTTGLALVPVLLRGLEEIIEDQHGVTLRKFLKARAEFRNHMLYATDGGSARLGNSLSELRKQFERTFHDLLWVLALIVGASPPSKQWGVASQFIGVYREALIKAKILKRDLTIADV